MEQILNSNAGSVNSGHNNHEIVDRFRFGEEVHNLMRENLLHPNFENPEANGNSFTALLGLPANQAIELLHEQDPRESTVNPSGLPFTCYPTFPTNVTLVERAAKFSVFASGEDSPQTSSVPSISGENSFKLKNEPGDYEPNPSFPALVSIPTERKRPLKRKDGETTQLKVNANKKSKSSEDGKPKVEENKESEKLPYVHVRARRGQATDSHSLAERARREKINARMKMLQELVPGCSKISGTALVLDEIINHVQSLQRQVEFLSMKLASVNPRIDFCLDGLLQAENNYGTVTTLPGSTGLEATSWTEIQLNGNRRPQHPQLCQIDLMQHQSTWDRDNNNISIFTNPENSLYSYESANSVSMRQSQLKMEL